MTRFGALGLHPYLEQKINHRLKALVTMDWTSLVKWHLKIRFEGHKRAEKCPYCP